MAQDEIYIIGEGFAPEWCNQHITPYRKADGSTGYEYSGKFKTFVLEKGDILEHYAGTVIVRRRGRK